jgi:hypothetical protein
VLENVLIHLKNWFVIPRGVHEGIYAIKNGNLDLPFLQNGQYYRICGSIFNDGLHKYGDEADKLTDETFSGTVWALAIPKAVVEMAANIEEWQNKNGEAAASPFASESFGGYSYTKATDAATGAQATWETVFRAQLNPYRKLKETAPVKPVKPWEGHHGTY